MAYGLRVKAADGTVKLDTTEELSRLRWLQEVAANASSNTTLSDISGLSSVEVSIQIGKVWDDAPHLISRSGTTISWTADSNTFTNSSASLLFVFLYT